MNKFNYKLSINLNEKGIKPNINYVVTTTCTNAPHYLFKNIIYSKIIYNRQWIIKMA